MPAPRFSFRARWPAEVACVLALVAGCNTFRTQIQPNDRADKGGATTIAGLTPVNLPSKNTLRTSKYFFYSDLELKADNPLFAELGDLRDQVVRELQLPQANTIIQVYLFEDRDKYDRFQPIASANRPSDGKCARISRRRRWLTERSLICPASSLIESSPISIAYYSVVGYCI